VHFELNGTYREVTVPDPEAKQMVRQIPMADPDDRSQIGASIPGMVSKVSVKPGDSVEENQVIAIVEAMKMETSVVARLSGTVDKLLISPGQTVKAGELLAVIR
jgi:pyruvate carboxylase